MQSPAGVFSLPPLFSVLLLFYLRLASLVFFLRHASGICISFLLFRLSSIVFLLFFFFLLCHSVTSISTLTASPRTMPSIRELLFSATPTLWRKQHHHSQSGRNSSLLSAEEDTPPEGAVTGRRTPSGKPHFSSASSDLSRSSSKLRPLVGHSSSPSPPCSTRSSPCLQQHREGEEGEGEQEIGGHPADSQGSHSQEYSVGNENPGRRSNLDRLHTSTSSINNTPRTIPSSAATSPSFDAELLKEHPPSSSSSPPHPGTDRKTHSLKKRTSSSTRNLSSSATSSYEEDDVHNRKTSAIRVNGVPLSKSVEGEGHSRQSATFCTSSSSPDLRKKDSTACDPSSSSSSSPNKHLNHKGVIVPSPSSSALKISKSTASLFSLFRSSKGGGGGGGGVAFSSSSGSVGKGQTGQVSSLSPSLPDEGPASSSLGSPSAALSASPAGHRRSSSSSKQDPFGTSSRLSPSSAILISASSSSPDSAAVASSSSSWTRAEGDEDGDALASSSSSSSSSSGKKSSSCLHASTIAVGTSSSSSSSSSASGVSSAPPSSSSSGLRKLSKAQSHHGHSHTSPRSSLPNPFFHRLHHSHHQGWMLQVSPRPPSKNPYPLCAPLRNGVLFPLLGLGTYRLHGDECMQTVKMAAALRQYMLIDTASVYRNEEEVGKALRDAGKGTTDTTNIRDRDREREIEDQRHIMHTFIFSCLRLFQLHLVSLQLRPFRLLSISI